MGWRGSSWVLWPLIVTTLAVAPGCSRPKPKQTTNTCYASCNPTVNTCGADEICSVPWQLTSSDQPVAVTSDMIGVCVPAGTYADQCATDSTCSGGQVCKTVPVATVTSQVADTTFDVMPHMLAAVEMQLAGEPLAESMGRELTGYSRDTPTPNVYLDPSPDSLGPWIDLVGFATAVESYEYSKQPMNELNFESGAGISLVYGPVINPTGLTGSDAISLIAAEEQHLADLAGLTPASGATPIISWNQSLEGQPPNVLGWPGLWPTLHPYEKFDPTIHPTSAVNWLCSISSDDTPGQASGVLNEDYECDYTTLHLPSRSSQITFKITPGASGWAGWKSALWVMNYLQIMHDVAETGVDSVDDSDLPNVGSADNMISGDADGTPTGTPGVYLGSSNIEGFQAGNMILELDNEAQHWLTALTTTDGTTLTGFVPESDPCASITPGPNGCDPAVLSAIQYDYTSPLRWLPSEIGVAEDNPDAQYGDPFPMPTNYLITSAGSDLLQLDGLLGAYSSMYALTDRDNSGVGGTQTVQVYFDGDPFPQDDGLPDGEPTLHDRSLAMMKFVTVTLDRLHADPATNILVDDSTVNSGNVVRGSTVKTSSAAYTIVALRNVRRTLGSLLQLYSNTTPDEHVSGTTPLDTVPLNGAPGGATFTGRITTLIQAQSDLLLNHLTTSDGHAYDGWDLQANAPVDTNDDLDAHTAAIRGLLAAYLSTGNDAYRQRAIAVFNRMDAVFYDPSARIYDVTAAPQTSVAYTPMRFAMLEGALRDLWELVGSHPGQSAFGQTIQSRILRLIKLVLNGWDDRNTNQTVDWPGECTNYNADGGFPLGGLQMAERALSGEIGSVNDDLTQYDAGARVVTTDRESDCVPDIAARQLPSALANEVDFTITKP